MTLSFTLSIAMTSDWHIGSGQGRHRSIDRLIDRDYDDLPFIPAATVRGIWRDSAQLLARGLDSGEEHGPWSAFAERLFGSEPVLDKKRETVPTASLIKLADARFPESLRAYFIGSGSGRKALRQALTFIKPGVSIDARSGAAKTDFLRFEEVARDRAVLEASGEVDCLDTEAEAVGAFLTGAAALIERLGGKRRRGMGKCTVTVAGASFPPNASAAADILENAEPKLHEQAVGLSAVSTVPPASRAGEWTKIPLRIELLSPLVAADAVQGNVITCQDHIPSGLLLAPIASRLASTIADVWALIASGDVRVLPGTPEIGGRRSLPLPFCWEEEKGKRGALRPYRQIPRTSDVEPETRKPQHVSLRAGFVSGDLPVQHQRSVAKILRTHNTIKDEIQRPHEDVGGVYTYEALAAGQIFRSEVWIRNAGFDEANVREKLGGEAQAGRARQAGYGCVRIEPLEQVETEPKRAIEDGKFTVWLTSDAILSGPMGAGGLDALADAIAGALGKKTGELFVTEEKKGRKVVRGWGSLRWRRVEGWQSRWGLPRPTLVALQAGSVAEFELLDGVTIGAGHLEQEGIGGRRGEGFGCVVADHPYLAIEPEAEQLKIPIRKAIALTPPEKVSAFVKIVWRRAWERCIALRAEAAAGDAEWRKERLGWEFDPTSGDKLRPNMSQLGALRAVMGELSETDLETVRAWTKRLGASGKWSEKAFKALKEPIDEPNSVWPLLGLDGGKQDARFAGAPEPERLEFDPFADSDLQRFAIRTLLLKAMRFHKRDSEPKPEKHSGKKEAA